MIAMIVRTGFKIECDPAGQADCRVEGDMDTQSIEDVIDLLEMIVRRLRSRIEQERERHKYEPVTTTPE